MKWMDKELVEGTTPPIRIGRRVFKSTDGSQKATDTYWATFSAGGKQRFLSLEVFKRADAIREAHRLAQRLETQTQPLAERTNIKFSEIVDGYGYFAMASRDATLANFRVLKEKRLVEWICTQHHYTKLRDIACRYGLLEVYEEYRSPRRAPILPKTPALSRTVRVFAPLPRTVTCPRPSCRD